jgi:hypothetical protein
MRLAVDSGRRPWERSLLAIGCAAVMIPYDRGVSGEPHPQVLLPVPGRSQPRSGSSAPTGFVLGADSALACRSALAREDGISNHGHASGVRPSSRTGPLPRIGARPAYLIVFVLRLAFDSGRRPWERSLLAIGCAAVMIPYDRVLAGEPQPQGLLPVFAHRETDHSRFPWLHPPHCYC